MAFVPVVIKCLLHVLLHSQLVRVGGKLQGGVRVLPGSVLMVRLHQPRQVHDERRQAGRERRGDRGAAVELEDLCRAWVAGLGDLVAREEPADVRLVLSRPVALPARARRADPEDVVPRLRVRQRVGAPELYLVRGQNMRMLLDLAASMAFFRVFMDFSSYSFGVLVLISPERGKM